MKQGMKKGILVAATAAVLVSSTIIVSAQAGVLPSKNVVYQEATLDAAPADLSPTRLPEGFQFHEAYQLTDEGIEATDVTFINPEDGRFFSISKITGDDVLAEMDEDDAAYDRDYHGGDWGGDWGHDDHWGDEDDWDEWGDDDFGRGEFFETPVFEETITVGETEVELFVENMMGATYSGAYYEIGEVGYAVEGTLTKLQLQSIVEQLINQSS